MIYGMSAGDGKSRGRTVAGYTRVSRVGGRRGEGFISQEDQQEGITARAQDLELDVVEWFHDPDYTGGNLQRPEWERLMSRILDPADPVCGVIVVRVDRFARTVPEGAPEVKRIWDSNRGTGIFVAADLPVDTTQPHGRKMLWDWLSNAEFHLEMLKAQWWRSKKRAIARGAHIGRTPLGMRRIPKNADQDAGKLVHLPEWIEPKRAILDYCKRHPDVTDSTACRWANENAARPDGRRWTPTTIGNLRRSRVNLGEVAYRPRERGDGSGEPAFEAMVNTNAHEAIVDEATFQAAQRTSGRPPRTQAPPRAARLSTLRGLLRCAGCRHTLVPSRGGANIPTYRCDGESSAGRCPAPATISAHIIEPWVLAQVREQLGEFETFGTFLAMEPANDEQFAEIEARRERAHEKLRRITENTDMAADDPSGWKAVRRAALAEVREEDAYYLEAIRSREASPLPRAENITWETITGEELRDDLFPSIIDCVYVRQGRGKRVEDRALILWYGQADPDLPGKGRPAPEIRSFEWPSKTGSARGAA